MLLVNEFYIYMCTKQPEQGWDTAAREQESGRAAERESGRAGERASESEWVRNIERAPAPVYPAWCRALAVLAALPMPLYNLVSRRYNYFSCFFFVCVFFFFLACFLTKLDARWCPFLLPACCASSLPSKSHQKVVQWANTRTHTHTLAEKKWNKKRVEVCVCGSKCFLSVLAFSIAWLISDIIRVSN